MTAGCETVDRPTLHSAVAEVVREWHGPDVTIRRWQCERSPYASSYPTNILTLDLSTGEQWTLLQKDLGHSRVPKNDPVWRRQREMRVYQDLLRDGGLGTPRFHGVTWHEPSQTYWLFMELVEAAPLKHLETSCWIEAVGWLGRLHGKFAGQQDRLARCRYLARHDRAFYEAILEQTLREVAVACPDLLMRWQAVVAGYRPFVRWMADQPPTLVHGDYRPSNILVDRQRHPVRICPVDWERAAVGSVFFDIAMVADGFPPPVLAQMLAAYRAAAEAGGVRVADDEQMKWWVDCFRLFRIVLWLSRATQRASVLRQVGPLVESAEAQLATLQADAHGRRGSTAP